MPSDGLGKGWLRKSRDEVDGDEDVAMSEIVDRIPVLQ